MITQLQFENFKALQNAEIKLGAFNVIVGPNGSGKSSVLQALETLANPDRLDYQKTVTLSAASSDIRISTPWRKNGGLIKTGIVIRPRGDRFYFWKDSLNEGNFLPNASGFDQIPFFKQIKIFSFDTGSLGHPVGATQIVDLQRDGRNLTGALTHLRDKDEDAYNQLREEFQKWVPEYDSIGFSTDQHGNRHLTLRQKVSKQNISASQASEGTLLSLALLTIVYQPNSPSVIGLEEPDRGLHPRLLRELRDALYRLSFPSDFGINRLPVQVVVTTHSPFFLDLFKDHPEQVIIAEKLPDGTAKFKNLSDDPKLHELIGDAPLGEVWYSGILGGVPVPA